MFYGFMHPLFKKVTEFNKVMYHKFYGTYSFWEYQLLVIVNVHELPDYMLVHMIITCTCM